MAPGLDGFLDPSRNLSSLVDGRPLRSSSPESEDAITPDEMAMLEDTYQGSQIQVGEEVEVFAKYLDDCLVSRGSPAEQRAKIFKLVDHYYDYTRDRADVLRERQRLKRSARRGASWQPAHSDDNSGQESNDMDLDEPQDAAAADLKRWEEEAQTWDLLRRLLPLRYRDKTAAQQAKRVDKLPQSRRQYWADFLCSEPKARERKTILEWLQTNASTGPDIDEVVKELQRNAERGEILAHGWLHTRGAIKQHKRLVASSDALLPDPKQLAGSNLEAPIKLVTQLDPDVQTRQHDRKLAPQDAFFERAIWLGCFELLRRGRSMAEIRDWCTERTEIWRAATISALPLSNGEDEDVPYFDPLSTLLWRRMCFRLAQEGTDGYERAVYGILSGDLLSVEAVSKTWDDFTFAKYNAELRAHFDAYLKAQCDHNAVHALTKAHGDVVGPNMKDDRGRKPPSTTSKALQAAIVEDRLDNYLYQGGIVIAKQANKDKISKAIPILEPSVKVGDESKFVSITDHDGIRILAHVLIIVSALDKLDGKDPAALGPLAKRHQTEEHVIAVYTQSLKLTSLQDIIPLYSSRLLGDRRYSDMSRNLVLANGRDTQLRVLGYMKKLGLDIVKFVESQAQLYLSEVRDVPGVCPAKGHFSILQPGLPTLKYGRLIRRGIFGGDDVDELVLRDKDDEVLIRSMEWLLLVDGLVLETCEFGIRIYKYFLKHQRLGAARVFSSRVPCSEIIRQKTGWLAAPQDESDPSWWDEVFSPSKLGISDRMDEDSYEEVGVSREELAIRARPLWEMECLVNALDCLETTSTIAEGQREDPSRDREVAKNIEDNAKIMRGFMKPLLKDWLLTVEEDVDFRDLRETYLPEVVIAYASTLQFAGTTATRDYLLECMDLASVVAEKDSDLAAVFVRAGRMKELVESFASCSKALAIWTTDLKKGGAPGGSSKKLREMGWSRELWTVKPGGWDS